jgi:mono/diheme cytochrome c family protein
MNIKTNIFTKGLTGAGIIAFFLNSCTSDPLSPGLEYMPDMYRSPSIETYSTNPLMPDSMAAMTPVEGTVPRGKSSSASFYVYPYKNDSAGYEDAGKIVKNPIAYSASVVEEGKVVYTKFCVHCHGASGQGDGMVVTNGGFPPPPAYNGPALKDLPEGKMYHTITYGKGNMGSHASQLSVDDRWKVIHYIKTLQNPAGTAAAPADAVVKKEEKTK